MQHRPAYTDAVPAGETRIYVRLAVNKSNSPERVSIRVAHAHTKRPQRSDRIRHQPFATRFVNRGIHAIGNDHPKALSPNRNRSSKTHRPAADDKHVGCRFHPSPSINLVAISNISALVLHPIRCIPRCKVSRRRDLVDAINAMAIFLNKVDLSSTTNLLI
jgi:hypothetical protein